MTTVLIIEDMDELREEVVEILTYEGFDVLDAPHGKIGLELAQQHLPDIILCDIAMPEMDGYETLTHLKQNHSTAHIPFIFLTAKVSKNDMRRGMDLGADDYLTKPFTAQELMAAISARLKQKDDLINFLTQEDQLTHLPTAFSFYDRLKTVIDTAKESGQEFSLFLIDIDHFNLINNNLGFTIGDTLFQMVAQRLKSVSACAIARLRGDSFALAVWHSPAEITKQLWQLLREPYPLCGQDIFLTVSMGIALYPRHGETVETLIRCADLALYQAKEQGGNTEIIYSPDLSARSAEYMALSNNLLRALERQEFCVYYQPILAGADPHLTACEALVRWQHPQLGLVSPSKFIPLAEELGMIKHLGEWVTQTALSSLLPYNLPPTYRVAVNVSAKQLAESIGFTPFLANLLSSLNLSGDRLELELTESTFIDQSQGMIDTLQHLRAMGIHIAIDDFGTGYCSLGYLRSLPINSIKIDRSFIMNITHSNHDRSIVKTMVGLAHDLGLYVTAEGVETKEQLEFLQSLGCDRFQGYLFTPPIPLHQFHHSYSWHP
jgi:diguanylate cyclase (GGDEF)-like protein